MVTLVLMLCIVWTRGEAEDEGLHQVALRILTICMIVGLMSGQRQRLEVASAEVLRLKLSPAFLCAVKTKQRMG